ncbi:MAG: LytTR family DNA-binding domain-containing protein [Lachnospiraceae bacterium]|nr:LytTR family DNA-binding domain-containing protein [Lachnospiraceae bacterium]
MYEIGICDDQIGVCDMIRQRVADFLLKRDVDNRIHIYTTGEALLEEAIIFDILFLDIELINENGLEIAMKYPHKKETRIIFLTSHIEEMPNGYKVRAFRFLTKPINQDHFEEAIQSALADIERDKRFVVVDEQGERIVRASEILYVEAQVRGCGIRTMDTYAKSSISFKKMIEELAMFQFYNSHKSYIVNMDYISKFDRTEVIMKNDEKVKISRLKKNHFTDSFYDYIRSRANAN